MFNKIVYQFSSTAAKRGIDNSANETQIAHIKELDSFLDTANESWQRYSEIHGIPNTTFSMCSGFRCNELNSLLGGTSDSPHTTGYAADITIKELGYWNDFCKWAADFAKTCASENIKYDQIIIEGSGTLKWIHFSLYDYYGNQQMLAIVVPSDDMSQIYTTNYGTPSMKNQTEDLTTDPMTLKHDLENISHNSEIEGTKGKNQMDLSVMPGTYMRCLYVMKRLITSLGLSVNQAGGVVGNILADTDGKISTTKNVNGNAGICQWDYKKQIQFRKMFLNEEFLYTSNLMNQVSFLIKDIASMKFLPKLQKVASSDDACYIFYKNYKKAGQKIDSTNKETKKDLSSRRGFSTAAIEIFKNYINLYDNTWKVGYYEGNGLSDGPAIQKTDDKKLWNSSETDSEWLNAFDLKETPTLTEDELDVPEKSDEYYIE